MRTLRLRLSGPSAQVAAMMTSLQAMDGVDRVEEAADEEDHERDDSSSLGLSDDEAGSDFHDIDLHATSAHAAEAVRERVEAVAADLDLVVEFVDEF